jgi:molybdopterin converting factor subunit 1
MTMDEITVRLFARFRELAGAESVAVAVPSGSTVAELRRRLALHWPAAAELLATSAVAVNADYASDDRPVGPGDEVALIPPVSGG